MIPATQNPLNPQGTSVARISKVLFQETDIFDPIPLRPYDVDYNRSIYSQRDLVTATDGFTNISTDALGNVARSILVPSSTPSLNATNNMPVVADIINGYNTKRFNFKLVVTETGSGIAQSMERTYVIQGFTDIMGASRATGHTHVDPMMKMFINNIFGYKRVYEHTPTGTVSRVVPIQNLLAMPMRTAMSGSTPTPMSAMRPEDVFQLLHHKSDGFESLVENHYGGNVNVVNAGAAVNSTTVSSLGNNDPAQYLSKIMNEHRVSVSQADANSNAENEIYDPGSVHYNSRTRVREPLMDRISSGSFLQRIMSETNFSVNSYFTYQEMCNLFPEFDAIAFIDFKDAQQLSQEVGLLGNDLWMASRAPTQVASIVKSQVPIIMTECNLEHVHFFMSNDVPQSGRHGLDAVNHRPIAMHPLIPDLDRAYIDASVRDFMLRFYNEVFYPASVSNNQILSLTVKYARGWDSYVDISIDNAPIEKYPFPSHASGLFMPVISGNHAALNNTVGHIGSILESVGASVAPPTISNHPQNNMDFNSQIAIDASGGIL